MNYIPKPIISFWAHRSTAAYPQFSNFFTHEEFIFEVPDFVKREGFPFHITCIFSEKAIMVCKAILMGDHDTLKRIIHSSTPEDVKSLGRSIKPWRQELWDIYIEDIAYAVVYQKFTKVSGLKDILLQVSDHIIAEASPYDKIWGIGMYPSDMRVQRIEEWNGKNILGYALMEVATSIKNNTEQRVRIKRHYD